MIVETGSTENKVIYQQWQDNFDMAGEPAVIVSKYENEVEIRSENGYIILNKTTIPDLIKVLKEYAK